MDFAIGPTEAALNHHGRANHYHAAIANASAIGAVMETRAASARGIGRRKAGHRAGEQNC